MVRSIARRRSDALSSGVWRRSELWKLRIQTVLSLSGTIPRTSVLRCMSRTIRYGSFEGQVGSCPQLQAARRQHHGSSSSQPPPKTSRAGETDTDAEHEDWRGLFDRHLHHRIDRILPPPRLHSASATKSNSGPLSYTSARPFKRKPRRRNGSTRLISMKGLLRRLRMVPGEGSQQTSLVNRLSCPTFPKSTIEFQCVFSTLSHQIGGQDSLRGSNHRPKWELNQGYDAQLLAQCICWNAWAQARQSIR